MPSKQQPGGKEQAAASPRTAQTAVQKGAVQTAAPTSTAALARSAAGVPLTRRDVMQLQRAVGNRVVGRLLSGAAPREVVRPEPAATPDGDAHDDSASQPSGPVIQRVLDHTNQPAVGFSSQRDAGNQNRVTAAMMRSDGTLDGSAPSADPPGYDYIRRLQLTNFWIRFHLVNEEAGGPGTANNLVPASKRDNSQYEVNVESDLKDSVSNALNSEHDEVFFGVEVTYGTMAAGTQAQQNAAPFFPTQLTYYHELYDAGTNTWTWEANGDTFDFQDAQPTDLGATINLSAITREQLRLRVYNYNWDNNDVAFINSLAGNNQARFEELIDENEGAGPAGSAAAALNDIEYGQNTTFGERIDDEDAIDALGEAIGSGFLVIA